MYQLQSNQSQIRSRVTIMLLVGMLLALVVMLGVAEPPTAVADGNVDAIIGWEYGSTKAQDSGGNDAANGDSFVCGGDANRGNFMDFNAYNSNVNDEWFFAWTVDSSQALNDRSGDFFGNSASDGISYIIGIDVGCNGHDTNSTGDAAGVSQYMNTSGTSWYRQFSFGGQADYFIAMYPTGADTLDAQLWDWDSSGNKRQLASNLSVATRVVDLRRQIELGLGTGTDIPDDLKSNSQICTMIVSTGGDDGDNIYDSLGNGSHANGCDQSNPDLSGLWVATEPYCNDEGYTNTQTDSGGFAANYEAHPSPNDAGTRQCLSNPARDTVSQLSSAATCEADFAGIPVDGEVDQSYSDANSGAAPTSIGEAGYVHLTELAHAGPYALESGGSTSDFKGESSAYQHYANDVGSGVAVQFTNGTADLVNAFVRTDMCFLYISVDGTRAVGDDLSQLYIAIDRESINSGSSTGDMNGSGDTGPDAANAPDGKRVNFRNWDPDYVFNVQDWTSAEFFDYNSGWTATTWGYPAEHDGNTGKYDYADCPNLTMQDLHWATSNGVGGSSGTVPNDFTAEVAIPWRVMGDNNDLSAPNGVLPAPDEQIRIGFYTAYGADDDGFDVHDQAPGVGQGSHGRGAHERIGDEPHDTDNESGTSPFEGLPFSGNNYGDGRGTGTGDPPFDAPASDRTSDVDTIEEYFVFTPQTDLVNCYDFGDNPEPDYETTIGSGPTLDPAPRHLVDIDNNTGRSYDYNPYGGGSASLPDSYATPWMGVGVDIESDGQPNSTATGDDTDGFDDHDGIYVDGALGDDMGQSDGDIQLIPGETVDIFANSINIPAGTNGYLTGWIDWNGNGTFEAGEALGEVTVTNGNTDVGWSSVAVPTTGLDPDGEIFARFRLSTVSGLTSSDTYESNSGTYATSTYNGWAPPGEVEDYRILLSDTDWGDLPDTGAGTGAGNYQTLNSDSGPSHVIDGTTYLGTVPPDDETDGQPDATATGDDTNDTSASSAGDDEDGITFLTPLVPGEPANIQVVVNDDDGTGYFSLFIDFDGDGVLETVDLAAGGTVGDLALTAGTHTITIAVPSTATGVMGVRARLTDDASQGGNSATGAASSGEVEDYLLATIGDYVWIDSDKDGTQNETNTGVNGVTVNLLDGNGDPVEDADGNPITTTTANHPTTGEAGWYEFPGLPAGSYQVEFVAPEDYTFTTQGSGPGSGTAADSDANVTTGITPTAVVGAGDSNMDLDAGLVGEGLAVGNRVWFDVDNNGIMDGAEVGIDSVTVHLYEPGPDGVPGGGDDVLVDTVTTADGGYYLFTNVAANTDYFIAVDGSTTGYGYSSGPGIGKHDPLTTEENQTNGDDGVPIGNNLVASQVFTLTVGGGDLASEVVPAAPGYSDADSYMVIDFGFTNDQTAVSLSDFGFSRTSAALPATLLALGLLLATGLVIARRREPVSGGQ